MAAGATAGPSKKAVVADADVVILADPAIDGIRLDGFVAGDAAAAKQQALALVASLGFRPIDAGSLAMARALEGMGTLNIALNAANGWPWQSGWKLLGPSGEQRPRVTS